MSTEKIWTDPHMSKMLLAAHLDSNTDAASRRPEVVDAIVGWVRDRIRPDGRLLDLGCGPGLYAGRFARAGFSVTGVDINPLSIEHARSVAAKDGLDIRYLLGDYLELDLDSSYDAALCVYCDFGALDDDQQVRFLETAGRLLVPGGRLVFDVFGPGLSGTMAEGRTTERHGQGGFWSPLPHELEVDTVFLPATSRWIRTSTLREEGRAPRTFVLSDRIFTPAGIESLLRDAGFRLVETARDLVPPNAFTSSDVLFVVAERL